MLLLILFFKISIEYNKCNCMIVPCQDITYKNDGLKFFVSKLQIIK